MWILFSPEYLEYTLMGIILIPGLIFAMIASARVKTTFSKYEQVLSAKGLTGAQVAQKILEAEGIFDVQIQKGHTNELVDNFNPKTKIITLSNKVYDGTSISSIGVAAHETGHAVQYAKGYAPMKIRTALAYVSNFMSFFVWPLILIGIILDVAYVGGVVGKSFLWIGVAFFGVSALFSLITLPVEFNASNRALKLLVATGCVDEMEVKGCKKVLSSAAMTYVAGLVVSILELLRFVLFFLLRSRDN